jgi:hypothetical protein
MPFSQRGSGGPTVGVDPGALLAAAAAADGAADTLDGFADLPVLAGADDAGTDGVAGAYGEVAGDWSTRRALLADDLRLLSAFAVAAVRAMTALDGQVVSVTVARG